MKSGGRMTAKTESEAPKEPLDSPTGANPAVASIFAGVTAVMWAQAIIRYMAANLSIEFWNVILPEKSVDVVAIWLTSILIGLFVIAVAYLMVRKRKRVGSVRVWIVVLLVSAIIRFL
jgi:hypothetical protein